MKKVGVIVVRKQWNCAPQFLIEGIKKGIRQLIEKKELLKSNYVFQRFCIHNNDKIYINPETLTDLSVLIIPFWIGDRIFSLNIEEIKKNFPDIKIFTYSGIAPYCRNPPFEHDFANKVLKQGSVSDYKWNNYCLIDGFFVVKKLFPYKNEIEVGCGQFDEWLNSDNKHNIGVLDFCKKKWDEEIWYDFKSVWNSLNKNNLKLIQLGSYPEVLEDACVFDGNFVHYRRLCKLLSVSKFFVSMNESFGYPILDNKMAGNVIFVHEKIDIPSFHFRGGKLITWNKSNLKNKIEEVLNLNHSCFNHFRNDFISSNDTMIYWENVVRKIDEHISLI